MNGWSSLFDRAMALLAAEPAPIVITIVLLLALLAVFALEGMRVTLTPRRRQIRYLRLHAPEDANHVYQVLGEDEASPALVYAGDGGNEVGAERPAYRSAGSRRIQLRRAPSTLIDRDTL
jgi:hypothetical protein